MHLQRFARFMPQCLGVTSFVVLAVLINPAYSAPAGAIPGQFAVSETGAATYTIPIQVPPGIAGMEPKLALVYNSQSGNGLLGVGWSMSGLSAITRCPRTIIQDGVKAGIEYFNNDKYCLDGQRLVAVNGTYGANGTEYRTELESFARIVSYWGNPTQIVVSNNDSHSKTTVNTYDNDVTNWILGRLRRATVTSTTP